MEKEKEMLERGEGRRTAEGGNSGRRGLRKGLRGNRGSGRNLRGGLKRGVVGWNLGERRGGSAEKRTTGGIKRETTERTEREMKCKKTRTPEKTTRKGKTRSKGELLKAKARDNGGGEIDRLPRGTGHKR
jgi:hypothetical protein